MSASKETSLNRPHSHYENALKAGPQMSRFLPPEAKNDPIKQQEVIDTVVAIAALDGTWGKDTHREVGRTLGIDEIKSQHSFLNQMNTGRLTIGDKFALKLNGK